MYSSFTEAYCVRLHISGAFVAHTQPPDEEGTVASLLQEEMGDLPKITYLVAQAQTRTQDSLMSSSLPQGVRPKALEVCNRFSQLPSYLIIILESL